MVQMMTKTLAKKPQKVSYLRGVQNEMKKVTWTSRSELAFATKTVIFSVFVFGFATYLVDLVFRGALDLAGGIVRGLFG